MIKFILHNAVVRFDDPERERGVGRRFHDKVHVHDDGVVEGFVPPAVYQWTRIVEIEGMDDEQPQTVKGKRK